MILRSRVAAILVSAVCAGLLLVTSVPTPVAAHSISTSPAIYVSGFAAPGNILTVSGSSFPLFDTVTISYDATQMGSARARPLGVMGQGTYFFYRLTVPLTTTLGTHTIHIVDQSGSIALQKTVEVKSNWPMFGFSPSGNRYNPYETAITAANISHLSLAWTLDTSTGGGMVAENAPTIANGRLIIGGGSSGPLNVYNADTGQFIRSIQIEAWPQPAYADNFIYAGTGVLDAFDAQSGTELWYSSDQSYVGDAPTVAGGFVYVQAAGTLYAYQAHGCGTANARPMSYVRCTAVWKYTPKGRFVGVPAVAQGLVYEAADDGKLYVLNAVTGALQWSGTTISGRVPSGPVVDGGYVMLHVGNSSAYVNDNALYVFNASGCGSSVCSPLWTGTDGAPDGIPPTAANGVVYAGSLDDHLYAFQESGCGGTTTCSPLWLDTASGQIKTPLAIANGIIYAASWNGQQFLAFDAAGCGSASCAPIWSYTYAPYTSGAYEAPVVANGFVYFINEQPWNMIYAFRLSATSGASSPGATHSQRKTGKSAPEIDVHSLLRPNIRAR